MDCPRAPWPISGGSGGGNDSVGPVLDEALANWSALLYYRETPAN